MAPRPVYVSAQLREEPERQIEAERRNAEKMSRTTCLRCDNSARKNCLGLPYFDKRRINNRLDGRRKLQDEKRPVFPVCAPRFEFGQSPYLLVLFTVL